ncbi:TPA_asm: UL20.4 [Human alphaherpesvirus 1]|nr:TPA_asm: UL20.4 [Human alphaherpesvirus 1]
MALVQKRARKKLAEAAKLSAAATHIEAPAAQAIPRARVRRGSVGGSIWLVAIKWKSPSGLKVSWAAANKAHRAVPPKNTDIPQNTGADNGRRSLLMLTYRRSARTAHVT